MQFLVVVAAALILFSTSVLAEEATNKNENDKNNDSLIVAQSGIPHQEQTVALRPRIHFGEDTSTEFHPSLLNHTFKIETTFAIGNRKGDFNWNIASDFSGTNLPNILSELSYNDLNITEASFDYQVQKRLGPMKGIYFESHISSGYIDGGYIQDSDYDGNDRSGEFSQSMSDPNGSVTFNLVNAIGFTKTLFFTNSHSKSLRFTPLIGYAYNVQSFVIREGEQTVATQRRTPLVGEFDGLDSSYKAEWFGFWLGLITRADLDKHHFTIRGQFHFPEYYAEANWNLRSDFAHPKSFAHFSDGTGVSVKINYSFQLNNKLSLTASYHHERMETRDGIDTIYFKDGGTASTRLNETNWESTSFNFGIVILTN